ncbi:unnamed protein product [Polarella glacialis]|uniref:Protein kinase domain-containing protein n=1 Tax=Polarella glacialis TaxID=89957 RepID=A0A813G9P8_POLGL|nr:unnamed protein product [Polarella glacialis]CAE8622994.1 unnamed protein product [Polarella glacialis]
MKQLLETLDELHLRQIVHCNIKRENVMFSSQGKITLIDFETAVNEHELVDMGTEDFDKVCYRSNPHFSAPEVLEPQPGCSKHGSRVLYGHRRDVYGAGVIMAELLLQMDEKTHLFQGGLSVHRAHDRRDFCEKLGDHKSGMQKAYDGRQLFSNRCQAGSMPNTMFYKHGADLVKHMTLWSRFKRARAWEALEHSFFQVDPDDMTQQPTFQTLKTKPLSAIDEVLPVRGRDEEDDYLYDEDYRTHTWRDHLGEVAGCLPFEMRDEEMSAADHYWYAKEGLDYIHSGFYKYT